MTGLASDDATSNDEARNIVMHVNFADPERFVFVLNNIENILNYYRENGNRAEIRVVCHGPGLHLLRIDSSPVLERLRPMAASLGGPGFYACSNTLEKMTRAEGRQPQIIEQATLVPAGLVEIIELQRQGWTYLKP